MGKWQCVICKSTNGIKNGWCPKDGPTQTNPVDDAAKKEAGVQKIKKIK